MKTNCQCLYLVLSNWKELSNWRRELGPLMLSIYIDLTCSPLKLSKWHLMLFHMSGTKQH